MLTQTKRPEAAPTHAGDETAADYLRRCMRRPQRHRLLHGYPLAAAMLPRPDGVDFDVELRRDPGRGLLVGVLPHPFCNPKVRGCGFCTFPHQTYDGGKAARLAARVIQEIHARTANQKSLLRRPVAALYFGGGTANLTPPGPFRDICRALAAAFDLRDAEVTLEGAPIYFLTRRSLLLDILREELPARHFRVSMGIQTFDEPRLREMGREAFGGVSTFAGVVEAAHARGFTASADLLFNLPGQTLAEMRRDVARADALGLDHLGLYHLVLFRGLGTEWSLDPAKLAALPDNEAAAANWVALRGQLLAAGFAQTTLTNFERADLAGSPRRFVYEEYGFRPDLYDMIGFGPGGISFASSADGESGLKLLNPDGADAYDAAAARNATAPWDRHFAYGPADMGVFRQTRRLAALEVGPDLPFDETVALFAEELIEDAPGRPTPRGMFYADAIASLFARRQIAARRGVAVPTHNGRGHM